MDVAALRSWIESKLSRKTAVRIVEMERTAYALARKARSVAARAVIAVPPPMRQAVHSRRVGSSPLLSVVVPVYNVEEYLDDAMSSILHQTYRNLEVIAVDDGSTDASAKILRRFARLDPRVRVITKVNGGLGAARNTGVRAATGDYLTFVDSDDFVPRRAYQKMVSTIEASGSDFVTGVLYRFSGKQKTIPGWTRVAHAEKRVGISLSDYYAGIINVYSVNKLYRRSFWDRIGAEFPEGIRYEDQYPITRAMILADSFDVIPDHVYGYRARGTGTSISEGKARIEDALDRIEVVRSTGEMVRAEGDDATLVAWVEKCLRFDMMPYIECALADGATDEYRAAVGQMCALWTQWRSPELVAASSVRFRSIAALAATGRWDDVRRAAGLFAASRGTWETETSDGEVHLGGEYRFDVGEDLGGFASRLADADVSTIVAVPSIEASGSCITLRGWAVLRNVDSGARTPADSTTVVALLKGTTVAVPLAVTPIADDRLPLVWGGAPRLKLGDTAFEASVGLDELTRAADQAGRQRWTFEVRLDVAGVTGVSAIDQRAGDDPALKPTGAVITESGAVVEWGWDATDGLTLDVREAPHAPAGPATTGGLRVQGELGRRAALGVPGRAPRGAFVATRVQQEGDRIVLHGVVAGVDRRPLRLALAADRSTSSQADVKQVGGSFEATIPLRDIANRDLPRETYVVRMAADGTSQSHVLVAESFAPGLPVSFLTPSHRVVLSRDVRGHLTAKLEEPLRDDERGPVAQALLQDEYRRSTAPIRENVALFHAYLGEHATDSSLAISEYLLQHRPDITVVWATVSRTVAIPDGAYRVVIGSREWYDCLATAKYLVHNIFFDPWFSLKQGQVFVQTWHGTPLKTILSSAWRGMGVSEEAIVARTEQSARWSYLVSPCPYFTEVVAREARFSGPVIESGYPRNDALVPSESSKKRREEVRAVLGIPEGKFAVLYAPTFRERLSRGWKAQMVSFLKAEDFSRELGGDAVLLLRGHGHNARAQATRETDSSVIDVSHYPNITELMLAADVIVTDYSSLFFDAVAGNKPIVFFVPDLKAYNNSARGVYLKLEDIAPGPLVKSSRDLLRLLRSREWEGLPFTPTYQAFKATYGPHDDGHASQRVVEAVFEEPAADASTGNAS